MVKTANIVVVGGGIVGCSIAAELAKRTDKVVLIEKEGISSQASGANFGMVWVQTRFPGYDVTMARNSIAVYKQLIEEDFDINIEFEQVGGLTIGYTEGQLKAMEWQCQRKQDLGFPVKMLSREDTLELEPKLSPNVIGSIFCEEDSQVNPYKATMAFANLAKRRGVEIHDYTEVTDIIVEQGCVKSVVTAKGTISTPIVINATGCWGRKISKMVGIDIPVFPQRLQALVTEPTEEIVSRIVQAVRDISLEDALKNPEKATGFAFEFDGEESESNLPQVPVEDTIFTYLKPTTAGTTGLGTTSEFVGYDSRTTPAGLSAIVKQAVRACPNLKKTNVIRTWANFVPFTFDGLPVTGKVNNVDGFIMATGHAHAMSHAPVLAHHIADLIVEGKVNSLLEEATINRFEARDYS